MDVKFTREALLNAMTGSAFKLGTVLTLGWFWMRTIGCHTVYRGQDGVMNYYDVQAVMKLADEQVSIPYQNLSPNTIWHYIRRQVSHCGLESEDSDICVVNIDSGGDMMELIPNTPLNVAAEAVADGAIKVRWRYSEDGQEIAPTGFKIYIDSGSGFDFNNPDATIRYLAGINGEYNWTSGSYSHNQRIKVCVRAYTTGAGETLNTDYAAARADNLGPDAITGLLYDSEDI